MASQPQTRDHPLMSEEEIARYRRDGAVRLRGVLSPEWLSLMSEVAEEAKQAAADYSNHYGGDDDAEASNLVADDIFMVNPKMRRFLEQSPIAEVAALGMGSREARIYEDLLLYKSRSAGPTPFHQDEPQWPVRGTQLSSVWFSLEATTPETGGLRFATGTHKGPLYVPYMPPGREDDLKADLPMFTGGAFPDVANDPERFPVHPFSTEPGDVILFHPRAIHAAFGNHQNRPRRSFTIRFLGDDVRWLPKRTVYHPWLKEIDLSEGAEVRHERFPRFFPRAETA